MQACHVSYQICGAHKAQLRDPQFPVHLARTALVVILSSCELRERFMHSISLLRFDAVAGYARNPMIRFICEELAWFEHENERVLGLLVRDLEDNDFVGHVFGRDRKGRCRWIACTNFCENQVVAQIELAREMERQSALPDAEYCQGDEDGAPVDFFALIADEERLHPSFKVLRDREEYSAARGIVNPMMRWHEDADGNFIEQFQTVGFDPRIWELYLFAALREMNFEISRVHAVPDFCCSNPLGQFNVEAVTVNPSRDDRNNIVPEPPTESQEQVRDFIENYMPIRFARSLTAKLRKQYWRHAHVADKPLLFAIQDFSFTGSMVHTRAAFERYIYGYEYEWKHNEQGELIITPRRIEEHRWQNRRAPSGFFNLPDAENVSAVLFSNSGTISKFSRMGMLAGFGTKRLRLFRIGTAVNHDQNSMEPVEFRMPVNDPRYCETWCEGIDIWHNPNAIHPLDPRLLPKVAHHRLLADGTSEHLVPPWHPLASNTIHLLVDAE